MKTRKKNRKQKKTREDKLEDREENRRLKEPRLGGENRLAAKNSQSFSLFISHSDIINIFVY